MDKQQLLDELDHLSDPSVDRGVDPRTVLAVGLARTLRAVDTLSVWLVQAQTGFSAQDHHGIQQILNGVTRTKVSDGK